jgi:site-specific DNA-methyltransferase (adenine-specific)
MREWYRDETGILYHGDCREVTITSPPYDGLRRYADGSGLRWDFDVFREAATQLRRVTKPGGVVVWVVGDMTVDGSETGTSFKQALYFKNIGFRLHDTMIYRTDKPPMNHNRYEPRFEYMFVLSKGRPAVFNPIKVPCSNAGNSRNVPRYMRRDGPGDSLKRANLHIPVKPERIRGNIWYYPTGRGGTTNDKMAFEHPAVFPEGLALDHIKSWSNPGDLVFDPFVGSGTVAKMAKLSFRRWVGAEASAEYCELTKRRLEAHT